MNFITSLHHRLAIIPKIAFVIFVVLLFGLVSGAAGFYEASTLFDVVYGDLEHEYSEEDARWRVLPELPEKIARLVAGRPYTIYAETINGNVLGCFKGSKYDVNCWFEVDRISEQPGYPSDPAWCDGPTELVAPDRIELTYCGPNLRKTAYSGFIFVLCNDGSIWQWGYDNLGVAQMPGFDAVNQIKFKYLVSGSILGVIFPWIIAIVFMACRQRE